MVFFAISENSAVKIANNEDFLRFPLRLLLISPVNFSMKTTKSQSGKQMFSLKPLIDGVRINGTAIHQPGKPVFPASEEERDRKEVIRRLRIQNKKLMERVASLNGQVKKYRTYEMKVRRYLDRISKGQQALTGILKDVPVVSNEDKDNKLK